MDWKQIILFVFVSMVSLQAAKHDLVIDKIIRILKRRNSDFRPIIGVPSEPEDLPEAEPIHPGHTLIRPSVGMLKSALRFPQQDKGYAVYGNLDNLGITYGKVGERILYTGFRRSDNRLLDSTILQAIRNIQKSNRDKNSDVFIIEIEPFERKSNTETTLVELNSEEDNDASEVLDDSSGEFGENQRRSNYRRKSKKKKYGRSDSTSTSSVSTESTDADSDYEPNPGNPYTVHKEKYKQNYLWHHAMDGDHMNVNPFAPSFKNPGPKGADLFFGRKWWYYNQDDYKPLR